MHCKLLLDFGAAARGGCRVAGHAGAFEALSFELRCPPEAAGDSGGDVELRAALAAGTDMEGLRSLQEAETPLATLDLTLGPLDPETGALTPLVEASLSDARVVSVAAERLVLRGRAATLASLDLEGADAAAGTEAPATEPARAGVSAGEGCTGKAWAGEAWTEEEWAGEEWTGEARVAEVEGEVCESAADEEGVPPVVT